MDGYIFPIKIAFITFPFLALLFTLPFIIFQYRKYGYINIGYLLAPVFLYVLPKTEELDGDIDIKNLEVGYIKRFFAYLC
jgi:hypothetical protein